MNRHTRLNTTTGSPVTDTWLTPGNPLGLLSGAVLASVLFLACQLISVDGLQSRMAAEAVGAGLPAAAHNSSRPDQPPLLTAATS